MEYNYSRLSSPVGHLHLISDKNNLIALIFNNNWNDFKKYFNSNLTDKKDKVIKKTEIQLKEYFSGKRKDFEIPMIFSGTEFQKQAWECLQQIPFGKTISYGEQARKMKNPRAVRAVGGANGKNKICIIVPCHRVIGQNGLLTGFTGGIKIKKQLLEFEKKES